MNRPTKITPAKVRTFAFTFLGTAASVGLWSWIAARPWPVTTGKCWERAAPVPPVPKKLLQEGYRRIKCEQCGQEYDVYGSCVRVMPTQGEIKHLHLPLKEETRMKKQVAESIHRMIERETRSSDSLATKAHLVKTLQGFLDE